MTGDSMTLEYDLARDTFYLAYLRLPWVRRAWIAWCLFSAVLEVGDGRWWLISLYMALAVECWFLFPVLGWCIAKVNHLLQPKPIPVQVETDDQGLRVQYHLQAKSSPVRYWWSRVSGLQKDTDGLMLLFDRGWIGLHIPWKAFANDELRTAFLEIAKRHIGQTTTNAAR